MLVISQTHSGFVVRAKEPGFGRGPAAKARDLRAVKLAVDHYYGQGETRRRHHIRTVRACPFCAKEKES